MNQTRVWMAWETQRRSLNLSARLGAPLFLCLYEDQGWKRFPLSILKTVAELKRCRGQTVMVQNPSMILAAIACFFKKAYGYKLVVDRHSNFAFLAGSGAGLKRRLSDLLSEYTLRNADLTIVTNPELCARVKAAGGRGFILPDPFPDLTAFWDGRYPTPKHPNQPKEILFVSSWAFDEPIAETIEACRKLQGRVIIRITGKMKPEYARIVKAAPANFILTGFLSDDEYFRTMLESDAVMAVTTRSATLVCGGYEGVVMGKPLILGDSLALRQYFDTGCVYTTGTALDIESRILDLLDNFSAIQSGVKNLLLHRRQEWDLQLSELEEVLKGLEDISPDSSKITNSVIGEYQQSQSGIGSLR